MKHARRPWTELVESREVAPGRPFARHLREALQVVGLGTSGWMLGCGDADELRTTDSAVGIVAREPGFLPLACEASEYPRPLYIDELTPALPLDYLDLRFSAYKVQSHGSACSGASDMNACLAALEALPSEPELVLGQTTQLYSTYHLRGTRGDELTRVGTLPELFGFVGDVDSAGDARLLVASQGYELICGESGVVPREVGFDVLAFTYQGCDGRTRHLVHVDPNGQLGLSDTFVERDPTPRCIPGRCPEGFTPRMRGGSLGQLFADCAALEAASVPAFVRLARELEAHGAPPSLVARALRASRDEVRHARRVGALARRFGVVPSAPRVPVGRVRPLEQVAHENAVEGCVRETYAALVAHHQAARAVDPSVAATYRGIAGDETRHAELSWDVASWLEPRLPISARRRVAAARRDAASSLVRGLGRARFTRVDSAAGLPAPPVGLALAEKLGATLWRHGVAEPCGSPFAPQPHCTAMLP